MVVVPTAVVDARELDGAQTIGRLGIGPSPLAAVVGVSDPSSPAYRAGLAVVRRRKERKHEE